MAQLEDMVEARLRVLRGVQSRTNQTFTIFRVPAFLRESSRTSYEPRLVSIGPYYHGAAALRAMEDHKWRYLHDLLSRRAGDSTPVPTASALIAEVRSLEAKARACYSEDPVDLSSDDFVQMLLLDGCFILEFFFKLANQLRDKLCDVGWGLTFVLSDLLLMENQIPLFVLERLYATVAGERGSKLSLLNLLIEYIGSEDDEPITRPTSNVDWEVNHILHLYYEIFVPKRTPPPSPPPGSHNTRAPRVIPCAVEMSEAGVTFAVRQNPETDYDVVFDARRGVMEIPTILIDDAKTPLLTNLIAFEQSQGQDQQLLLSSYVALMGQLIVTARDVALLRRRGVLENKLANDDDAARFFNHLGDCGAVNHDSHAFVGLYKDVDRYCGTWWRRRTAALRRDYFASPWSAISFVAAAVAVVLAVMQTYFTMFPLNKG
ncbi:hypothetical protein OsI_02192 [Oryza sativa Indica Group]|uniref:Uncharacterized protein n=1 Tax=Oryza sativa subsp. indica TaxID=39946 RepID=A2WQQ7_ORYSI|nr:hypothetical protein OsI_02192 [Oryza sativa Indica Group]